MVVEFKNILVIQTAFLGDAILCIPLLKNLRKEFPKSQLTLSCRAGFGAFFTTTGLVDQVIEVDKKKPDGYARALEQILLLKPDLIVSPHRSFRTATWVWRASPFYSVGYSDFWSFFAYKQKVRRPQYLHDVYRQLMLLQGLGVDTSKLSGDLVSVRVNMPHNPKFASYKGAVVLAPGSQWNTKRWTPEGFTELARMLVRQGEKVLMVGSPEEKTLCDHIASQVPEMKNLCGTTTIVELAQVIQEARVLICNDSGTMHVATSVGTPVVAIFGPTVPAQGYSPWGEKAKILEVQLPCRPCGAHGHNECPIGTHACMKKVLPENVLTAASEYR